MIVGNGCVIHFSVDYFVSSCLCIMRHMRMNEVIVKWDMLCVSQQTKMIQLYTDKVCCFLISVEADISEYGAMVSISTYCSNHHKSTWQTAGESRSDSKPINSQLLGSVLYTGSQPAKVLEWVVHHKFFHVKKVDNLLSPVSILPVIIIIPDYMEPQPILN